MDVFHFDSSAIVKRYLREIGSAWVRALVDPASGNRIYVARITGVEVVAAIARNGRLGSLSASGVATALADFRRDLLSAYKIVEITPRLLARAMSLAESYALRGYDAVQLAAALGINAQRLVRGQTALTLVSADLELNTVALAEGLTVDDPNTHP